MEVRGHLRSEMAQRSLTEGEKARLRPIFGLTLPYDIQLIRENTQNIGGKKQLRYAWTGAKYGNDHMDI